MLSTALLLTAALKKNLTACAVIMYTGQILGEALANFIMISSPKMIIISGDITFTGELFLAPTLLHMEQHILPIYRNKVSITVGSYDNTHALLIGTLAWFTMYTSDQIKEVVSIVYRFPGHLHPRWFQHLFSELTYRCLSNNYRQSKPGAMYFKIYDKKWILYSTPNVSR